MYSNKKLVRLFEQMLGMGDYFSSGRPVYVNPMIIIEDICSKIPLSKNDILLDVGCGTGLVTIPLALRSKHVYALDAGEKVLERLKENCKKRKIKNISFIRGWMTSLPFKNNFFDKVLIYAAIHYLENGKQVEKCIQELVRVCKPEGYILLAEIPEKRAREEFELKKKKAEELKILTEFKKKRKKYDQLFKKNVALKVDGNKLVINGKALIKMARKQGRLAKLCHQDIRLPFSLTRRDLVILPKKQ